ncbi:hypothetical protein T459_08703 [Capsicum annuum]|uniref:Uncharacterized protein n=1 Tax=Capsicum annuum TaxID=4072 RepID=A0A2G2ZX88_CAPAN|nr:hypothetical protein T459_08703 [Capsicum annuum]
MAEGTRMRLMDEKLAQRDDLLLELRAGQQTLTATQTGIQGTLELLLEQIHAMERGPQGGNDNPVKGGGILPLPF